MAFLRSLFSGVSSLRNHQTMMDVIGNNIANVNTAGYKASRASFSELYSQTIQTASRPSATNGGTNAMQVGLGMSVSSLDATFNQGSIERTGGDLDLAVFGPGFFVVKSNGQNMYTRDGQFKWDADGRIVTGSGAILQGKMADATGTVPSGTAMEDIQIDAGIKSPAKATSEVKFAGNLLSSEEVYAPGSKEGLLKSTVDVFDSLGNKMSIELTFTKTATDSWTWTADIPAPATGGGSATHVGDGILTFDNISGALNVNGTQPVSFIPPTGASDMNIDFVFGTLGEFTGVTGSKLGSSSIVKMSTQDGYAAGTLLSVAFDEKGYINGTFSNGTIQKLAQIMLAEFANPSGLMRAGDNAFSLSANSGSEVLVNPGDSSTLTAGAIEQSNVDLADEFTKMITAQRGFQASARVISTSDEFLQEVVNLKR